MICIGIFSAFLVIRTLAIINESSEPVIAAGVGLALGNMLVFIQSYLPLGSAPKFSIVGLSLIPVIFLPQRESSKDTAELKSLLPFIYIFYLIGGLFYGFIMPEYNRTAIVCGIELLFYMVPALVATLILKKERELLLAAGILFGMLAFLFLKAETSFLINLSMFSSQASFAFIDLYIICLLVSAGGSIRTFGYGIGIVCLAILSGKFISNYAGNLTEPLVSAGNIILTVSVLNLYLSKLYLSKKKYKGSIVNKTIEENLKPSNSITESISIASSAENNFSDRLESMLDSHHKKFSEKEKIVLNLALQGKTYKEIASNLNISESSVKTYMKRVCGKMGAQGKENLIRMLTDKDASNRKGNGSL